MERVSRHPTSDYPSLDIIPFGVISERLSAGDESLGFIEVSFTPPTFDCKGAFDARLESKLTRCRAQVDAVIACERVAGGAPEVVKWVVEK